ncbi:hypothetical protein E4P39_05850 [Blastococcus sp. CT_GayMR19]|uniref:phage tail protein n=1 Tax=Blastococcus sp. CT_GayMR19 TaxID=2559608 RepID=UPI0010733381|nr:hypothetical protein [Blastococcus sp. CT_GayMR19]TFV77499.1 hypothetical protein E4P39_05850 [Blastococcus sp. CT_GayMR19]
MAADPKADPRFAAVEGQIKGAASSAKKHPTGAAEADQARKAAEPPADDKASQAKAAQADTMAAAKPKGFDKAAFMAAVKTAIAKSAPQNLDEADKFATSGKADAVKGEVMGKVTAGKQASAGDIAEKTAQPPDPSAAKEKAVTPLPPQPPAKVPAVDGAKAMPGKAPAGQTDLRAGPCGVSSSMAEADVSDKDLAASNEPQMQQALAAKQEAQAHAAEAPGQIRQKEGQALQQAQAGAGTDAKAAVGAMVAAKGRAGGQVGTQKNTAKAREETERKRISGDINKIYDRVKGEVEAILKGLDTKVSGMFEKGEAEARAAFTAKHKADMEKYKDARYSGPAGWARWTGDLFMSVPKEANDIFVRAKALYEEKMSAVISGVADLIGGELDAAKEKIAAGRREIKAYVASQPKDLQKIAEATATEVSGKFDQLESDVDEKQESLVEDLAQKYVEARNAVDEEIKAEQAKNEGLVDKAKNAVGESIGAILKLKDLFLGVLSKAAAAFKAIVAAPVTFISNFMSAVKQGFMNFASNILEHLKKGLQGWLFGQLANAGIQLPEKFDLMGIVKMLAQLLGLTWSNIKGRILAKMPLVAKVIDVVESKIEIFVVLATKGIAGIWDWIKEKVGDVKEMIFGQIKSFVIEKVVKAGITWVLGMLNPAGALIKIVQALISVVQWIMERGQEMGEFIGTIIDAVMDIARGGMGGVPAKIEAALSRAVPLVISFLAGLLGLGGISEKVKAIFEKAQGYVGKAVDWVVDKGLKMARPLIKLATKALAYGKKKYEAVKGYVKKKYEAGKAYVKKKYEAAKGYVKGKVEGAKEKLGLKKQDKRSPAERSAALQAAMQAGQQLLTNPQNSLAEVRKRLPQLKRENRVKSLGVVIDRHSAEKDVVHLEGANSPRVAGPSVTKWTVTLQRQDGDGAAAPVTATGQQAELAGWTDSDIATLVMVSRAELRRATGEQQRLFYSLVERGQISKGNTLLDKTVACGGGVTSLSGWGTQGRTRRDDVHPLSAHDANLADVAAGQRHGTMTGLFEQGKRRGVPAPLVPMSAENPESEDILHFGPTDDPSQIPKEARAQKPAVGGFVEPAGLGGLDQGVEEQYATSHAERQVFTRVEARAVGVTRPMCSTCQDFFVQQASTKQVVLVVSDTEMARVFLPNGTMMRR